MFKVRLFGQLGQREKGREAAVASLQQAPASSFSAGMGHTGLCRGGRALRLDFLVAGNGVSLWLAGDHDLFVSAVGPRLTQASFDGFTESEQASMEAGFRSVSLEAIVLHEDEDPPDV